MYELCIMCPLILCLLSWGNMTDDSLSRKMILNAEPLRAQPLEDFEFLTPEGENVESKKVTSYWSKFEKMLNPRGSQVSDPSSRKCWINKGHEYSSWVWENVGSMKVAGFWPWLEKARQEELSSHLCYTVLVNSCTEKQNILFFLTDVRLS